MFEGGCSGMRYWQVHTTTHDDDNDAAVPKSAVLCVYNELVVLYHWFFRKKYILTYDFKCFNSSNYEMFFATDRYKHICICNITRSVYRCQLKCRIRVVIRMLTLIFTPRILRWVVQIILGKVFLKWVMPIWTFKRYELDILRYLIKE